MEQHEEQTFTPLNTETMLSSVELQQLIRKTIEQDNTTLLERIKAFRLRVAEKKVQESARLNHMEPADDSDTPYEIHHNIAVDTSKFPNFEAALKRFSALSRREGLVPKQRQFAEQGDRFVSRHRAGRFERVVFPVGPGTAAMLRDRRRKAMRGELQESRARVRPREIVPPVAATSTLAPIASPPVVLETPAEYPVFTPHHTSLPRRQFATGPRDEVLIVIEFTSNPPKFGVIKDEHKALIGFPFGGKDDPENGIIDASVLAAALREAREEFFYDLPVMLSAGEENIIATMPGPEGGTVHIAHLQVPEGTPYRHGKEQTDSALATEQQIDDIIAKNLMLAKHKEGWLYFKETVLLPRFFASLSIA